jgi:putative ABC transport system ATP-binding protein
MSPRRRNGERAVDGGLAPLLAAVPNGGAVAEIAPVDNLSGSTAVRPSALELESLVLRYRDGADEVVALNGIDLTVGSGELVVIIGPSGSGKSSLLAVAGALLQPTSGTVRIAGTDLGGMRRRERAALRRDRIGFIFQSGGLFPSLTALEQLLLVAEVAGQKAAQQRDRAEQLLRDVGLGSRLGHRPDQLSGGERQRVAVARALMGRPSLLLADEPTASLDRARSAEMVELLAEQTHRHGAATVLVTHDPDGLSHADRVLTLVDGRLTGA